MGLLFSMTWDDCVPATSFAIKALRSDLKFFTHVIKSRNVASCPVEWFLMCWNSVTNLSLRLSSMTDTCSGEGTLARKLP